jgi:hypothetical protein
MYCTTFLCSSTNNEHRKFLAQVYPWLPKRRPTRVQTVRQPPQGFTRNDQLEFQPLTAPIRVRPNYSVTPTRVHSTHVNTGAQHLIAGTRHNTTLITTSFTSEDICQESLSSPPDILRETRQDVLVRYTSPRNTLICDVCDTT